MITIMKSLFIEEKAKLSSFLLIYLAFFSYFHYLTKNPNFSVKTFVAMVTTKFLKLIIYISIHNNWLRRSFLEICTAIVVKRKKRQFIK